MDDTISQYRVGLGGLLSPLSPSTVAVKSGVSSLIAEPSGHFVYTVSDEGKVSLFHVPPSGRLLLRKILALPAGGNIVFGPDGKSAYFTLPADKPGQSGHILQFHVQPDGTLVPLLPAGISIADGPYDLVFSPNGQFAYVLCGGSYPTDPPLMSSGHILPYKVSPNGMLHPIAQNRADADTLRDTPTSLTVNPIGRFLYVSNSGNGSTEGSSISQFHLNADGTVAPLSPSTIVAGSPREVCCGRNSLAIAPNGRFAFFVNSSGSHLWQFRISSNGTLSPLSPETVNLGKSSPLFIAVENTGHYAYVTTGENSILQYRISTNGSLIRLSPFIVAAGQNPISAIITPPQP